MRLNLKPALILDFDLENRPLSYLGQDWTTSEVTAIAASFDLDGPMATWILGEHDPAEMAIGFRRMYDIADIVTGHYIRVHDLPKINSLLVELGEPPLGPKLTIDTKLDLKKINGVSKSQESLADMLGVESPKIGMNQASWRAANRLQRLDLTRQRVEGDVRQHQELRLRLTELGWLNPPEVWSGGR